MKKLVLVAGFILAGTMALRAEDSKTKTLAVGTEKPGAIEAAAVTLSAMVQDIDYKARTVTLKDQDGNVETIAVGPEVTRFNEVKKGDMIDMDVLVSVAVMVQSPDKKIASAEGSSTAIVRNAGKKPSGVATATDVVTATVVKIDAKNRKATLKGPKGNTFPVDVASDVPNLENVKVGDQVLVKVTRTVALDVRKATKEEKKAIK